MRFSIHFWHDIVFETIWNAVEEWVLWEIDILPIAFLVWYLDI